MSANEACLINHTPESIAAAAAAKRPFVYESLGRVDWMRPPNPPPAPAATPGEPAPVTSEQAPVHPGEETDGPQTSNRVERFVQVLQRRHDVSSDAALAIALAALSAAAGPGRTIRNPLGGTVTNSLNIIIEDAGNARVRRAARQALRPFQEKVDATVLAHQESGAKHQRRVRMELEAECARAVSRLHSPPTSPPEPFTIPVPPKERAKQALAVAADQAQPVAEAMHLHEFEERPFVITDGLSPADILDLPQRSFDGALFSYSPGGDALRQLEAMRATHRREVLRFLVAAWHGESFAAGAETILAPAVTNLWLCDTGDTMRLGRNPAVAASGWLETVLVVAAATGEEQAVEESATTDADAEDEWRKLIEVVSAERIIAAKGEHELSEAASRRFREFHADTIRRQVAGTQKFTAWWPEQVLKIALLLHLDSLVLEVPQEVGLATLEEAIACMEQLGAAQLRVVQSPGAAQDDIDTQVEIMVGKVRADGPLPKWDLFRRYHVHRAELMEPILARCCERQFLQVEGNLVRLADPDR